VIAPLASSLRQRRWAVAAFFGLVLAIVLWSATFLHFNRDLQAEFDAKSNEFDALKIQSPGAAADGNQPAARYTAISAPTETVAASELHKNILLALEQAGGTVREIQAEATTDVVGDGLRRLNAQAMFDSSIDSLQKILFKLETAVPFIFIDSINVQLAQTARPGDRSEQMLRVTLVSSSYWNNNSKASAEHQ
jgi:hypothetical protein